MKRPNGLPLLLLVSGCTVADPEFVATAGAPCQLDQDDGGDGGIDRQALFRHDDFERVMLAVWDDDHDGRFDRVERTGYLDGTEDTGAWTSRQRWTRDGGPWRQAFAATRAYEQQRLVQERIDLDGVGPELESIEVSIYQAGVLVRRELDFDRDGRANRVDTLSYDARGRIERIDSSGAGPNLAVVHQYDDQDDRVATWTYLTSGRRSREQVRYDGAHRWLERSVDLDVDGRLESHQQRWFDRWDRVVETVQDWDGDGPEPAERTQAVYDDHGLAREVRTGPYPASVAYRHTGCAELPAGIP